MVGGVGVEVSVEEAVKVFLCLWHSGLVDGSPVVEILEEAGVGDLENLTCQSVAWAVGRVFAGQVGRREQSLEADHPLEWHWTEGGCGLRHD